MLINFTTSREYDGPQHMSVAVEEIKKEDWLGFVELVVTFSDSSRHIKGRMVLPMMNENFTSQSLEREVMASYDLNLYTAI